jgi:hypothetical protein
VTATDAMVVAFAATRQNPIVLTSDPADLAALAEYAGRASIVSGT